ncbi:putative histidine kinase-like ATPase domain-containing protein [Lupinus albus]|uniref:Putative histidine kinase-like ATPase domain-containing protein n=1 Tax=Lupinus albus TaxID=3870 RepID=A0A6A4P6U9_LUPAL|nr:putative histidine kinase-like ATPase domain-containing protein [Lupinus albus]
MATPKQHIEEIRRTRFSIGGELNPLAEDLHQAVKNLSVELYAKDVHFLMELIQNAEDNQYSEGVRPTLQFILTSKDITATGAPATLLIFNNEKGFSPKNVESVCSVGRSTKKGNRRSGYIGEKGIGFKSVFLVTAQPYIFSNGYQIRFNENPCPHSGLGYIVPEWVEVNPTPLDIKKIYGNDTLPTTTIVLPLKPEKVKPVKHQLSNIHPEVLLFLSKIKHLSVKEVNEDPKLNSVSSVAISSEVNFMTRKNMNAESYTLLLSAEENGDSGKECSYYMWKQRFPVRIGNVVERRKDVEEWVITLAFPNHERLHRGQRLPGVYSFLPTEMVTNFPFIIQADFVLASSRETILLDNKWNLGILECVPSAFMAAFKTLVLASDQAPVSSLPRMFKFLPVDRSSYEKLNNVREKIKEKLVEDNIIPIETYSNQKHFYKPSEVGRLLPDFWNILTKARAQGVYLHNNLWYDHILQFLGVKEVNVEWYAKCIQSSNLVDGVSEAVYLEVLLFVAVNWSSSFSGSNMINIPLIKYVDSNGSISHLSLHQCTKPHGVKRVMLFDSRQSCPCSWLINWNQVFGCPANLVFMPEVIQHAICRFPCKQTLMDWLGSQVNVATLNVYSFSELVCSSIKKNHKLAISYCHFLYHSKSKGYLSKRDVDSFCISMPLVDSYGSVVESRNGVLVPANVSKWADLIVSNPWLEENYIELGKEYLSPRNYSGQCTCSGELITFLKIHVGASDIPDISPPNAVFSSVYPPLTKDNAFLLLDWIRNLKDKATRLPKNFLKCIREGSWLKVTVNGYRPPSKSFLIRKSLGELLQSGSVLVDIPLVDESFYGARIKEYEEELKTIGVMFSYDEACKFIGEELMSRAAASNLSKSHIVLMLKFIKYLRESLLPLDNLVNSIKHGSWLKTSHGLRSPVGSVLFDSGWLVASQISSIPFIDLSYFGVEIFQFKEELKLLGVIVGFSGNYKVVIDNLKPSSTFVSLTAKAVILLLECIKFSASSKLLTSLKGSSCFKTNIGFKTHGECFLFDPVWGCILEVFDGLPVLDHKFYGDSIFTFKYQLKQIGVMVDFDVVVEKFAALFKQKTSQTSFNKQHVYSFLSCLRRLKGTEYRFGPDYSSIIRGQNWLHTRLCDYRTPRQCILYGPEWKTLFAITCLPFLNDTDTCYGKRIHEYKEELKWTGVVTELKDGLKFVPKCLNFSSDPSSIIPESVFSLLECFKHIMPENNDTVVLDEDLLKRLSKNWLKTHAGYRSPDKCLLFDSKWSSFLKPTDGPFIDEKFYGPKISDYKKKLVAIGVTVDAVKGCSLLANHLQFHSDTNTIVQIYRFLYQNNWKPEDEVAKKIWIPDGDKGGEWVDPEECILHDKDNLFGFKFFVLEGFYDRKILPFFSFAMQVKNKPSVDDYVDLWNDWENSAEHLLEDNCYKFWMFILQQWSPKAEKILFDSLKKLPATSGNNEIFLVNKEDVFIGDNLHLMKLFEGEKVFVWYPKQNFAPLDRCNLIDIYRKVGARNFSESLRKEESSFITNSVEFNQVDASNVFNLKGLVKLILGFLASNLKMEPEKRHKAVQGLVDLSFYETSESVTVSYGLSLSSGDVITKKANKMVRWEKGSSKFFTQKMSMLSGNGSLIKYATYFSEAISEGVLCENFDQVGELVELIKLAYVLNFKNEEIEFLMESKNLQIFCEDEEFLSSAFSSA